MAALGNDYGLFWNSDNGDRVYDAESFEEWLRKFFTSGVFVNELQVVEYSGVTISITAGYANVNGKVMFLEEPIQITLDAPNSIYPRIDTIVIRRDNVERQITIEKVTGAYAGDSPQPTAPIRTDDIYELVLAQIYIDTGASSISQADITDTRMDSTICGYVTGTVEEIDWSQITAQFNSYYTQFTADNATTFYTWFNHMKDQLDSDAAGHLQNEIDQLKTDLTAQDNTVFNFQKVDDEYGYLDTNGDFQAFGGSENMKPIREKSLLYTISSLSSTYYAYSYGWNYENGTYYYDSIDVRTWGGLPENSDYYEKNYRTVTVKEGVILRVGTSGGVSYYTGGESFTIQLDGSYKSLIFDRD